jgi:hypothetical protein
VRLFAPAVSRARTHFDRFPSPFRWLLVGAATTGVAGGTFVPNQGVLDFAFAISFGPAAFAGIALAGSGHGEVFLAYAFPLSIAAAFCFVALTRGPRGSTGLAPA